MIGPGDLFSGWLVVSLGTLVTVMVCIQILGGGSVLQDLCDVVLLSSGIFSIVFWIFRFIILGQFGVW